MRKLIHLFNMSQKQCKKCFEKKLPVSELTKAVPAPYFSKVVCGHCDSFIKWGTPEKTQEQELLNVRIDCFFATVDLSSSNNAIYQSFYYQWMKKRSLSPRQMEVMYKHPKF